MMLCTQKGFFTSTSHCARNKPIRKVIVQPKPTSTEPKAGWGEGLDKGRVRPALLAASRIGVSFLGDETEGKHYFYFLKFTYEAFYL